MTLARERLSCTLIIALKMTKLVEKLVRYSQNRVGGHAMPENKKARKKAKSIKNVTKATPKTVRVDTSKATRGKLKGTPFSKAAEMNSASQEIRKKTWEQFERAKIFYELSQKPEYNFINEEFKEGLKCKYGDTPKHLVKVFSVGKGIEIDINRDLVKQIPQGGAFIECLIRSLGDTFSKSYYQAKGIMMPDQYSLEEIIKSVKSQPEG